MQCVSRLLPDRAGASDRRYPPVEDASRKRDALAGVHSPSGSSEDSSFGLELASAAGLKDLTFPHAQTGVTSVVEVAAGKPGGSRTRPAARWRAEEPSTAARMLERQSSLMTPERGEGFAALAGGQAPS